MLNDALGLEGDARELALGAPQAGVPIQLVMSLGVASIAARELSRPFRTTTHRLAVAAVLGALLLPVASPYRVLCGVLAAGVTAGLVRLAFGTAAHDGVAHRRPPRAARPRRRDRIRWTSGRTAPGEAIGRRRVPAAGAHDGSRRVGHAAHGHGVAVPLVSQQREQPPPVAPPAARAPGPAPAAGRSSTT